MVPDFGTKRRSKLQGKSILIVEDEALIALALEDMLAEFGCHLVGSAQASVDAIALIANAPKIDAAILDVELDDGKSWPVAEALTARSIPFAFSTGHGHDAEIDPRFTAAPILDKPFDTTQVRGLLAQLLLTS